MRRAAFTDGRSCGELGDAKVRGACSETRLVALVNATSSRLSIVPFANGPKISVGFTYTYLHMRGEERTDGPASYSITMGSESAAVRSSIR